MKTIKSLIIVATLFLTFSSNSQTITPLPQFKNELVVVRTFEELGMIGWTGVLNISDGSEINYSMELSSLKPKNQGEITTILAQVSNELKKQKYKLITSNSGGAGGSASLIATNYIYQKE